jgi:hypothetical protein
MALANPDHPQGVYMENETETETKPIEQETPVGQDVTEDQEADETEVETSDDETSEQPEEGEEEFEFDGQVMKGPKKLAELVKKASDLEKDYTQGKQEIAEISRAASLEREELEIERKYASEVAGERSQLASIESQLAQFQNVNWAAWRHDNPQEANAAFQDYQLLKDAKTNVEQRLDTKLDELKVKVSETNQKQLEAAAKDLRRPDPKIGWQGKLTPELQTALHKFATTELGWDKSRVNGIRTAAGLKELNLMRIGSEALKAQRKTLTPKPAEANPVPQVGGARAKGTVDPDKMTFEQWSKWDDARSKRNR